MGNAKRESGRLGPYRLGRRYSSGDPKVADLGHLYEAHNEHTGASAVVLLPHPGLGWEPEKDWKVSATARVHPPYVALEVEQASSTDEMAELAGLAGMFDVLARMMEQLEWRIEARWHLAREPEGRLKRWGAGARRVLGTAVKYGVELTVAAAVLGLVGWHVWAWVEQQQRVQHEALGVAEQSMEQSDAPTLANNKSLGRAVIAYPVPAKPFRNQAKAPCNTNLHEVEINGGCWMELALRPPCGENLGEYRGKCYVPVSASSHESREPQSLHR